MKSSTSLVVIGHNSIEILKKIYTHEYLSALTSYFEQLIYVDSNSSDESAEYMKKLGFSSYKLLPRDSLSASAGRYIGTLKSNSNYILFLDSDMEIQELQVFFRKLHNFCNSNCNPFSGLTGNVIDHYPSGNLRLRIRKATSNEHAQSFGGFILLERAALLEAGNWDYRLKANEELDLYCRLTSKKKIVKYDKEIAVTHYTEVPSQYYELLSLYLPLRKNRYGSLGKAYKIQLQNNNPYSMIRMEPEPFLFIAALGLLTLNTQIGIAALVIYETVIIYRKHVKFNLVAPGLAISLIAGLLLPLPKQIPDYEKV